MKLIALSAILLTSLALSACAGDCRPSNAETQKAHANAAGEAQKSSTTAY